MFHRRATQPSQRHGGPSPQARPGAPLRQACAVALLCLGTAVSAQAQGWTAGPTLADGGLSISAPSVAPVEGMFDKAAPAQMQIRCASNNTSVSFSFTDVFLSDVPDYDVVTLRLDGAPEQQVRLVKGDDDGTLVWPTGREAVPFLLRAIAADTLQLKVTALTNDVLTPSFSLAGLTQALGPVRRACNW